MIHGGERGFRFTLPFSKEGMDALRDALGEAILKYQKAKNREK